MARSLNIAMVHRDLPLDYDRGGVSYHVHYLANCLVARGHRVTVFSSDSKPDDADYDVRQIELSGWAKNSKMFQLYGWPLRLMRFHHFRPTRYA